MFQWTYNCYNGPIIATLNWSHPYYTEKKSYQNFLTSLIKSDHHPAQLRSLGRVSARANSTKGSSFMPLALGAFWRVWTPWTRWEKKQAGNRLFFIDSLKKIVSPREKNVTGTGRHNISQGFWKNNYTTTLPKTNIAPENRPSKK